MNYHLCEAIVPYYDECGANCTYILLKDGSKVVFKMPVRTYLRKMFYSLHMDPVSLNHWSSEVLHQQQGNPIIISEDILFIPVRMREVVGQKDGTLGYVLESSLVEVQDYSLRLRCGEILSMRCKASYVGKKQKDASLLRYAYQDYWKYKTERLHS